MAAPSCPLATSASLPLVLELSKDPVPNIRFNAAKTLGSMIPLLNAAGQSGLVRTRVKAMLVAMGSDADGDVQYYSAQALELITD